MVVPGMRVYIHFAWVVLVEKEGSVFSEEASERGTAGSSVEPQNNWVVVWVVLALAEDVVECLLVRSDIEVPGSDVVIVLGKDRNIRQGNQVLVVLAQHQTQHEQHKEQRDCPLRHLKRSRKS